MKVKKLLYQALKTVLPHFQKTIEELKILQGIFDKGMCLEMCLQAVISI